MTGYSTTYSINRNKELTEREFEVLLKIVQGLSNKEIAKELFITHHTVKAHISAIFKKLGVGNRTEAAMKARDIGLI